MKEDLYKGLTEEQIAKVKACKNQEELLQFAKDEGIELTEEQLEVINGGMCSSTTKGPTCIFCGSSNTSSNRRYGSKSWPNHEYQWYCEDCRKYFN